jgi:two-component system chemotaxis response regulator CheB
VTASEEAVLLTVTAPDGSLEEPPEQPEVGLCNGNDSRSPGRVIFIAGSAGSLSALRRLCSTLSPAIDAAVLIMTHLPPTHRTYLADILARCTSMPVNIAREGTRLAPGHVYIAPPGYHHVVVRSGRIHLQPQPVHARRGVSIDPLFASAAREFGASAVGVVLSGANTNGAAGVRTIRAAGGTTLAQRPGDAAFPVMPQAALAAGVDYCGSAEDIGRYLSVLCAPRK